MMDKLLARGEELAAKAHAKTVQRVAQRLRALLRGGRISIEDLRVVITGRGIIQSWLNEPDVRFVAELLK